MNNLMQSRIASALIAAVGVWLVASPLVIAMTRATLINTFIVGGLFVAIGAVQFFWENTIPSWIAAAVAAWMAVAIVAFSITGVEMWSYAIAAAATFLLASWDGIEIDQVEQRHHVHA